MKLFFYCKRPLQMYMTYTWSQITITFWLFQKCVFCVLHACYTLFSDIRNLQIHHLWSILKQFLKDFKNNTQLLRNFLRATITASFQTLHRLGDTGLQEDTDHVPRKLYPIRCWHFLLPLPKYLSHLGNVISS